MAQEPILIPGEPKYDKKEEILYDGKRYRKYNDYLNIGTSFFNSTLRNTGQHAVSLDFHFHIRRQYFQTGISINGNDLLENNKSEIRLGYGYRKETPRYNLAFFGGPTLFYGVYAVPDTAYGTFKPVFFQGVGLYGSAQIATKFMYDIGFGVEVFGEVNYKENILGIKLFVFFSGAYRGVKKNYNPHVKSENKK